MRAVKLTALALGLALAVAPLSAWAQKGDDAAGPGSEYVGSWSGSTDWDGAQYDNPNAAWTFNHDGSFVDDTGEPGAWIRQPDGSIQFQYLTGGMSVYTGRVVGNFLLGTMTNGDISGVFALQRR